MTGNFTHKIAREIADEVFNDRGEAGYWPELRASMEIEKRGFAIPKEWNSRPADGSETRARTAFAKYLHWMMNR